MRFYLGRFIPLSPNAFLGHMSAVVYFGGCNWRCPYCNVPSILDKSDCEIMLTGDLFSEIVHAREFIDAVVFTGGEPTLQPKPLISLCELVKSEGLSVKVHTNGSNPGVIKELLVRKLVDVLAIDLKTFFNEYSSINGGFDEGEYVEETIKIAKKHDVQWELVIPVIKGVNEEQIPQLVKKIKPPLTVLRGFEKQGLVNDDFPGESLSHSDLISLAGECKGKVHVKTKLYGEEKVS